MSKVTPISSRKADHIRINLEQDVRSGITTGLEDYRFTHQALPELDLETVKTEVKIFNRLLAAPILISSMTGGTEQAANINRNLAIAAQETGVALGLGSQRAAIEHPELIPTFQVRQYAPGIAIFANLGAIQLNYSYGIAECQRAVEMVEADALILHLNPLQEAVQPEGNTRFSGLWTKIEQICRKLAVPVIAKEVGWGISKQAARQLHNAGVSAIDVAGAGGTSWSQVEMHRAKDSRQAKLAAAFMDWGIPTAQAILNVKETAPSMTIFASGGLRTGVDIAKCIALGATLGGMASPFLKAAVQSEEKVVEIIQDLNREITTCMFAAGAKDIPTLQCTELEKVR